MQWYNEPPAWSDRDGQITVQVGAKTDFWRKTHYGFIRDNGNFYYRSVSGNFTAEVVVRGQYETLYDQAGLMLRSDEGTWLKCGVEFVNGVQQASAVVTRSYSDWSVVPLPNNPPALWLRVKRDREAVEVSYSTDGVTYTLLRLAYLTEADPLQIGIMAAAPQGEGFLATFEGLSIISNDVFLE
jgi:uncharacterized protein